MVGVAIPIFVAFMVAMVILAVAFAWLGHLQDQRREVDVDEENSELSES